MLPVQGTLPAGAPSHPNQADPAAFRSAHDDDMVILRCSDCNHAYAHDLAAPGYVHSNEPRTSSGIPV
jgi:hypothetical protein